MPLYEYRCPKCHRRENRLFLTFVEIEVPTCPRCQVMMVKLISRFSVLRSEDAVMEDLADPANFADVDEQDPRSLARWARRMGRELGEDLGPEFDEVVEALERGEDLASEEEAERDLEGMDAGDETSIDAVEEL